MLRIKCLAFVGYVFPMLVTTTFHRISSSTHVLRLTLPATTNTSEGIRKRYRAVSWIGCVESSSDERRSCNFQRHSLPCHGGCERRWQSMYHAIVVAASFKTILMPRSAKSFVAFARFRSYPTYLNIASRGTAWQRLNIFRP
jgi:hypothetical protein